MFEVITYIALAIGIILCPIMFWSVIRNAKVYHFRVYLIELCSKVDIRDNIKPWVTGSTWDNMQKRIPAYNKMAYSFKKLTLENWLSEDDIKLLRR